MRRGIGGFGSTTCSNVQSDYSNDALGWAARASKALGSRIEVRAFQVPPGE